MGIEVPFWGTSRGTYALFDGATMARSAASDKRFLETHNGKWRVVVSVPKSLQKAMGKTKLKQALGTDSLAVANELKWGVIKRLKDKIRDFESNGTATTKGERLRVLNEAAEIAKAMAALTPEHRDKIAHEHLDNRVMEILGAPVRYQRVEEWETDEDTLGDAGILIPIYDTDREKLVDEFMQVALHGGVPIAKKDADYKSVRLNVSPRTEDDHDRALSMLSAFCIEKGIGDDVMRVDEHVATAFIAFLENTKRLAARTIKKYVSRLKLYFAYLKSVQVISVNPWSDAVVFMPTEKNMEKERPFTEQELVTLLTGRCKPALHDLMMIGALTGARLDAIVDLKVADIIADKAFRFKPQKREAGVRYVPIHSHLKAIVARRIAGKKPEDDLFPEYPRDPGKPLVERSFRASKHFTTYRRSLGVDDIVPGKRRSRVNFHSLRRWFVTTGLNARPKPPEGMIAALVGHSQNSITLGVYYEGPEMMAARKAINRIKLPPLDGSPIIQPQSVTPRN